MWWQCLIHNIKKAWQKNKVLTVLAFDIRETFDEVTEKKLTAWFWEQNILIPILRWIALFLIKRKAAIQLDGFDEPQEKVGIGVPQRSPVSPILFMLFTASLFKLFSHIVRKQGVVICGYIDDGLLTI